MIRHAARTLLDYLRTPAARSAEEAQSSIEAEIAFHVTERAQEYLSQGMTEDEARRAALARFGDAARIAAECQALAVGSLTTWHRFHLGLTGLLAAGLLGLIGVLLIVPHARFYGLPPGIAAMLDHDWTGDISGRILDDAGKPIAGAHALIVVKTWPDQSYFQRAYAALCDSSGEFTIENVYPPDEHYEVHLAAVAPSHVLKSSYHGDQTGLLKPLELRLQPSSGFQLRIEAESGTPLAGVEVLPSGRVDADGENYTLYFDSVQPLVTRTDVAGQVLLPYYLPGEKANLLLRTEQGTWEPHEVLVPAAGEIVTLRMVAPPVKSPGGSRS